MNRYEDIPVLTSETGKAYKSTVYYPDIPLSEEDYYVITTGGDRYDTLAQQFYNDYTLWWVIASANSSQRASLVVEPGVQIRIPGNIATVIANYIKLNK